MSNYKDSKLADMHTHSENSHDSVCKIEDMYSAQLKKGTDIFAVTDHLDSASHDAYDVFSPIRKAYDTVQRLNEKHEDDNILAGIEISEGFWFPKVAEKSLGLVNYDVVIGSVHLVKYKELTAAYSQIDFSKLPHETIVSYMDAYFDDVLTMTESIDFDILAHLTCPLRYICGKYGIPLDLAPYQGKINELLRRIIKNKKALEVNTSSYDLLGDFMPYTDILRKYYDMGGYLLTIGSDAHTAENASVNFDKAVNTLKEIGFNSIYCYKDRKPHKMKL